MVDETGGSNESFFSYFKKSRLLKAGLVFNLFYYLCIMLGFAFFILQDGLSGTIYTLDFQVFYEAGQMFLTSPVDIYTVAPNGLPYRYLPVFAVIMAPLVAVPMPILYTVNITLMMILNIGIVYSAYQVSLQVGVTPSTKNFEKTLTILFVAPQHIVNIMLGQITQLSILLVMIALFLLQSSSKPPLAQSVIVGFLVGIASTLKPFFLVLIPFLAPVTLSGRFGISASLRQLSGVVLGLFLSMLPNIAYFFVYPTALDGFFQVNLVERLSHHHSTSIAQLIVDLLFFLDIESLQTVIILVLGGFIFLRSYATFIKTPESQKKYLHHFTDMIFLILLVYPDSWFLFLAILYAFLGPSMLQLYGSQSISQEATRTLDVLWSGSNNLIAFFFFGIILHYLVLGLDPINPIWLAILYVLYHRVSGDALIEPRPIRN